MITVALLADYRKWKSGDQIPVDDHIAKHLVRIGYATIVPEDDDEDEEAALAQLMKRTMNETNEEECARLGRTYFSNPPPTDVVWLSQLWQRLGEGYDSAEKLDKALRDGLVTAPDGDTLWTVDEVRMWVKEQKCRD